MSVSQQIKRLRISMGLSQADLARLAGVSKRTVERAEIGKNCSIHTLAGIAAALDVPVDVLTGIADEENAPIRITISVDIPTSNPKKAAEIISAVFHNLDPSGKRLLNAAIQ